MQDCGFNRKYYFQSELSDEIDTLTAENSIV